MIGEKFNSLTVVSLLPINGKYRKALCKCDCGIEKIIRVDHLKSGRTKSCGCLVGESKSNKLFGNKFGLLTPIKRVGRNYRHDILWECNCDCGKTAIVKTSSLTTGNTKSCGCLIPGAQIKITLPILNRRMISRVFANKKRSIKFNSVGSHSKEQIFELLIKQNHKCANCEVKIKSSYHADHIYPLSKGGSNDIFNIQLLCPSCNSRKSAIDPIVFAQKEGRLL